MRSGLGRACYYALAFATVAIMCQSASAQWRTHYVRRDGLFHVEKYHTGNGLTPVGGQVLMTGITAFAPIVGTLAGREAPQDEAARDTPRALLPDDYIEQQRRANDLLERTAQLVNFVPSGNGGPIPPAPQQGGTGASAAGGQFGPKSPWRPRPNGAASPPPAPGNGTVAP